MNLRKDHYCLLVKGLCRPAATPSEALAVSRVCVTGHGQYEQRRRSRRRKGDCISRRECESASLETGRELYVAKTKSLCQAVRELPSRSTHGWLLVIAASGGGRSRRFSALVPAGESRPGEFLLA